MIGPHYFKPHPNNPDWCTECGFRKDDHIHIKQENKAEKEAAPTFVTGQEE